MRCLKAMRPQFLVAMTAAVVLGVAAAQREVAAAVEMDADASEACLMQRTIKVAMHSADDGPRRTRAGLRDQATDARASSTPAEAQPQTRLVPMTNPDAAAIVGPRTALAALSSRAGAASSEPLPDNRTRAAGRKALPAGASGGRQMAVEQHTMLRPLIGEAELAALESAIAEEARLEERDLRAIDAEEVAMLESARRAATLGRRAAAL